MDPICHPKNCFVQSNATSCRSHISPREMELFETFCEKCKSGSRHATPAIVERRICRDNIRGNI